MISPIIPITFAIAVWLVTSQLTIDPDFVDPFYDTSEIRRGVEAPTKNIQFRCGLRPRSTNLEGKVVGGYEATPNSWPWMVAIYRVNRSEYICGGAVINRLFILSAAHCVLAISRIYAVLGEHNMRVKSTVEKRIEIDCIDFHPKYDPSHAAYDDAVLLRVTQEIRFNDKISPLCLPWGLQLNFDLVGQNVTVIGWGATEYRGKQSDVLMEAKLQAIHPLKCDISYTSLPSNAQTYPNGLNAANCMCAQGVDEPRDACEGDSGGPLMHYDVEKKFWVQAGIVSKGYGCGLDEFPGVYTPTRNHDTLQWIKERAFEI